MEIIYQHKQEIWKKSIGAMEIIYQHKQEIWEKVSALL